MITGLFINEQPRGFAVIKISALLAGFFDGTENLCKKLNQFN